MIMVPANTECPFSWIREYYGYLMTELQISDRLRSSFNCVDVNPDTVPGGGVDTNVYWLITSQPHAMMVFHVHRTWTTRW